MIDLDKHEIKSEGPPQEYPEYTPIIDIDRAQWDDWVMLPDSSWSQSRYANKLAKQIQINILSHSKLCEQLQKTKRRLGMSYDL